MKQYSEGGDEKPRIKLPLVKQDTDQRLNDLERMYIAQKIAIEKMGREIQRLKSDIDTLSRMRRE